MIGEKSVSFIIVNYNGKDHLKECFSTLNKLNYPKDKLEFIMVDNGSKDGSVQFVKSKFKNVKIIQNSINEGFAKPNNDAAKVAKGDYIALINNDMKIDANWLNDMLETLSECDDNYVCVGSKILNWNGTKLDFAGGSISFYGHGYQYDFGMNIENIDKKYNKDRDILFACGGSMIIDKKIFLEIGGFDKDFFAYFEDVDLGWRLWTLGYKVRFCHKAVCYHKHNSTSKKLDRTKLDIIYNRNSLYTIYKNYENDKVYNIVLAAALLKVYKGVKYADGNYSEDDETKTQTLSLMEFMNGLSKMKPKRDYIQNNRKLSDNELISKFIDHPYKNLLVQFKDFSYNEVIDTLGDTLNIKKFFGEQKHNLLIISSDRIGEKMAGTGIRYLEMAKQLSSICNVTLAIPNGCSLDLSEYNINTIAYTYAKSKELIKSFSENDIILIQGMILELVPSLKTYCNSRIVIVDLYDPYTIENLEVHKKKILSTREAIHNSDLNALLNQIKYGDYFICANEKQKDFWIGMLSALNKVNPKEFDLSCKLEKLIGLVPFGISVEDPVKTRNNAMNEKISNFQENDKVFIWGGGVWNWFDPLTLIRAIYNISKTRNDIKLLFLGVKHPNPDVPEMEMTTKAIKLAEELDIKDKFVFFNMDWVDYNDRQNYLLESYGGISCHFDNLETRFSFRTRILDYLWAELPIIASEGDYFADEIQKFGLGLVVNYENEVSIEKSIIKMVDDKIFYEETKKNIKEYRKNYKWNVVIEPLKQFCLAPLKKREQDSTNVDSYNYIIDINQSSYQQNVGAIIGDYKIGQKFRCRYPNLTSIEVMFGTYARSNEHTIKFKMFDEFSDELVIEKDIDASILVDNGWFEINFKPIINSEGRNFYFYFEAKGATSSNCVTIFKDEEVSDYGQIWNNGLLVEGSLSMRTKCIITEHPISEKKGIKLVDTYYGEMETKIYNKKDFHDESSSYTSINMNAFNREISDIKKSISYLSKNVSELNKFKSKISGRLSFFRKLFRR